MLTAITDACHGSGASALTQCRRAAGAGSIEAAVLPSPTALVEAVLRCLEQPQAWRDATATEPKEVAQEPSVQTHCPHVAPALDTISTSQRQLTPWSQLNLGIPQVPAAAVTARQISPDAASSSGPSIMAATAALQPMCSTRRRPPLLSHPLAATAAMAAITAAPSSLSLFATASKPIRYVDAIERCAALHDVVSLWKASERDLRVHHWALLSLRAAKLRKEHKFKGMTLQRAQEVVLLIQTSALKAIQLEVCSVVDLQRLLLSWRLSHFSPPPGVLQTILFLLRPPLSASARGIQPRTATLAAAYKLRSADGDGLACICSSLLHFKLLGPHDWQMVEAVAGAASRRAQECSFKALAQLAHALSTCGWADAAAYHDIATAAIKQVHTAAAADIAWLLRTVTQPAILPLLPHPLMDALLQNAADAYMALLSAAAPTVVADPANRRWGAGMHYRDDLQTDYDPGQMGNRAGSGRRSSYTRYSNEPKVSGAAGAVPEPVAQIARILEAFSNAGAQHEMLLESCAAAATRVAGNLSLREVGDIAHALSKHGLSHDPLLSALTQRVCTVADSFQQHQPQARGQHHHQRSWQQRGKPAATTWALDHDFDDCDVWSDAAADGPAPVEQQAAQQKPVKQTTSISSSAMPRENPSETDVRMARARMAEFVRQATGQTATLTATTQHSKAAPSSGKASSTQQLMDLIAAARSIAGEWKGQGQVERMRMVSTVLDAVSWTCPEPHVQPAAWPVVAGVAELCVITRHTDEWVLHSCTHTLAAVINSRVHQTQQTSAQGGSSKKRVTQSGSESSSSMPPTPFGDLSQLDAARATLSLMHALTLFAPCVTSAKLAETIQATLHGELARAAFQLWAAQLPYMEPSQLCDMLQVMWLLGEWQWKQLAAPILSRLASSVEAAAQQDGSTSFLDEVSHQPRPRSGSVVSAALQAVKSLAGAMAGKVRPSDAWEEQVQFHGQQGSPAAAAQGAAQPSQATVPGIVGCDAGKSSAGLPGDQHAQSVPWRPSRQQLAILHQAVLCAASHQGTDHAAAACMAALGQHASSPAILRAAERAWDGEQPHMSAGQVKELFSVSLALGLSTRLQHTNHTASSAPAHVLVSLPVGGMASRGKSGRSKSSRSASNPTPTTQAGSSFSDVIVEVLPTEFSPSNASLQLLGTAQARGRWLRGTNSVLLHAAISAAEWDVAGPGGGSRSTGGPRGRQVLLPTGAANVPWLSSREHLLQQRVLQACHKSPGK